MKKAFVLLTLLAATATFAGVPAATMLAGTSLLSYLDSNQDKLIQSQMCYRYTIGQSVSFCRKRVQKY